MTQENKNTVKDMFIFLACFTLSVFGFAVVVYKTQAKVNYEAYAETKKQLEAEKDYILPPPDIK